MRPTDRNEFAIAIICALTLEADAVEALFDETYDRLGRIYGKQSGDTNSYITGRIGRHNVVLCYMPGMGRSPAASVASSLRISYTGVQLALVVGICGGAPYPSDNQQIFLGDVIISDSVIQYDFGRQYPGGFQRKTGIKDTLGRPNQEIRSLLASLKARRALLELEDEISQHLHAIQQSKLGWQRPALDDTLFDSSFTHKHRSGDPAPKCDCFNEGRPDDICLEAVETSCSRLACGENHIIRRRNTEASSVSVHIGTIASADTVMKSGEDRDRIVRSERVLGFEMVGAGVWDNIPCIVIKGVCGYADSHKSKDWQEYAAAVGASAAKAFLSMWTPALREDSFPVRLDLPRLQFFIGRTDKLDELQTTLLRGGIFDRIVALQGPPGIGKSSLALKYAYEFHNYYSAILWLDASSPSHLADSFSKARERIDKENHSTGPVERVHSGFSSLKQRYKRYSKGDQFTGLWKAWAASEDVQAVQRWLSKRKNNHWLLIFDNYRSSMDSSDDEEGPKIENFFPEARQGHMVITTQSSLTKWHVIRLGKMERAEEALQILSWTSGRQDISTDPHAMELVTQMDGLPLALATAGSYLSNLEGFSCRDYLELHEKTWLQLQRNTPQLPSYQGSLHSCWAPTFNELIKSFDVWMVLQHWACLDSRDVWFELLDGSGSLSSGENTMIAFNRAIRLLSDYGIVEIGSDPGDEGVGSHGYNLQRSFHSWLVNRFLNDDDFLHSPADLALSAVTNCSENLIKSGRYYKGLLRLLPHANQCFNLVVAGKTNHYRSETTTRTLCDDTWSLIELAKAFKFAGYGKTKYYSAYLGMLHFQNPGKVHFLKSETLLSQALRELEQADTIEDTESHASILDHHTLGLLKLAVLNSLRIVYMHISKLQEVEKISRQMIHLYRLTDQDREAREEQAALLPASHFPIVIRCLLFIPLILCLYIWGKFFKSILDEDTIQGLFILAECIFFGGSYSAFMIGWRDRRKTFALFVLSLVINMGHQLYDHGTLANHWTGALLVILMVLSTLPILYYEVLH